MAKIVLRRVASFNREQLLTSKVFGLRGQNSPFGRTRGNLLTTRASLLVTHHPMNYPNTTNQKSPMVYPHSTSVKGVDGKFDFFHQGSGFAEAGLWSIGRSKTSIMGIQRLKMLRT